MARRNLERELHGIRFKQYTQKVRDNVACIIRECRCEDTGDDVIDGLWRACRKELLVILELKDSSIRPLSRAPNASLSVADRETIRAYIDDALTYDTYLAELEDNEFEELYRSLVGPQIKAQRERRSRIALRRDRFDFFNHPSAEANFARWCDKLLTAEQAAALSFGKDPDVVTPERLMPYQPVGGSPFREAFKDRLDLIKAAIARGDISVPMTGKDLARWALTSGIDLPTALGGEAGAPENNASYWKAKYEVAQGQLDKLLSSVDDMPPKSRISIYRLIVGMAAARFEYRTDQRTKATSAIREGLASVNISLGAETIIEHLTMASNALEYTWTTPITWSGVRRPTS